MAVDSHIHLYPSSVYSDPTTWAQARGENYWLSCVAPAKGPRLQGWADVDQLLVDMDDASVGHAIILGWYWENEDTCYENIEWQKRWIAAHPDRLSAFAPFNAKGGAPAIDQLKIAFDHGFKGIGEINPPAQGYGYDDHWLHQALSLASEYNAAVNIHVTDPASRDYPGKIDTPFSELYRLAQRHPETPIVFAHLGGMMNLEKLAELPNVYLDTAATPLLYPSSIYAEAIARFGADRILFGSDYPLLTFPKRQTKPAFANHLEQIRESGLPANQLDAILRTNVLPLIARDRVSKM